VGTTSIEAANAFLRAVYPPAHNARLAARAAEADSAFTWARALPFFR
jgi:hypothetical protein